MLLENPFTFDVVFVDYFLEGWPPLSRAAADQFGSPDSIPHGRLFERAVLQDVSPEPRAPVEGGHAEMLTQLAVRQGALVIATTLHRKFYKEAMWRLRAAGAHHFLGKVAEDLDIEETRALILESGGKGRDERLWASLSPADFGAILADLGGSTVKVLQQRLASYGRRSAHDRDDIICSTTGDKTAYLVGSLAWLREPNSFYPLTSVPVC